MNPFIRINFALTKARSTLYDDEYRVFYFVAKRQRAEESSLLSHYHRILHFTLYK